MCIFCKKDSDEILHDFTSLAVDKKIRDMAKELEDFELLSSISGGDLVAIEAQYHIGCLTKFRNSHRSLKRKEDNMDEDSLNEMINESRAFVELTTYIETSVEEGKMLFKLSELHSMYEARLGDLGIPKQINKTRLKDVRANCFCASLLRTQMHSPRHTRERALSNKMRNDRAKGHCYSFAWI